ncbi:PREDICTED: E3 ubiquitin/ISG15 ligase TRIM25-like [Nanorana parkeri]|uniref:E3 ubiquitin/ISG15 ligase TRIM25-like n=1 Tax=Nanorana parkeri TaxID=125878 RepID=UPI0008548B1D|nr:PREDICTED: E3 ubiquitin/ISG15 ligase TRIM25-like [Nanorana parkeri]
MASADLRQELDCFICLSTYTDPVNLRCGHNFCRVCIDCVLDTQEGSEGYSCPECREEFQDRPVLQRNITLRNIAETFRSTQPDQEKTGIFCTYCIHSPVPAVKSCLLCEASLCDNHRRVHSKSPEHVLTEPTTSMEKRKCSIHRKILAYYCIADAACICVSCRLDGEHQGHKVETLDEASERKKQKLSNLLQKLITEREETEKKIQSLQERKGKLQEKEAGVTERVTALFRDLRRHPEDLEKRVLREISRQEERLSHPNLIQKLEIKKAELSRKMGHIEEMCNMTDPLTVLQESDTGDLCDTEEGDDEDRERHDKLLHDGGDLDVAGLSHTLHSGLSDMMKGVNVCFIIQEASDIVLDVNTAHNNLQISEDMKTVSRSDIRQNRPETPERFQFWSQVLSSQSFDSGRHYWEVDVSESENCAVGMCYPSIERGGMKSGIGRNNKSWGLYSYDNGCYLKYDKMSGYIPHDNPIDRVRIYLDYEAGQLSFYDLCDPIRHLHTFTTTFTEPLHAGLWIGSHRISGSSASGFSWTQPAQEPQPRIAPPPKITESLKSQNCSLNCHTQHGLFQALHCNSLKSLHHRLCKTTRETLLQLMKPTNQRSTDQARRQEVRATISDHTIKVSEKDDRRRKKIKFNVPDKLPHGTESEIVTPQMQEQDIRYPILPGKSMYLGTTLLHNIPGTPIQRTSAMLLDGLSDLRSNPAMTPMEASTDDWNKKPRIAPHPAPTLGTCPTENKIRHRLRVHRSPSLNSMRLCRRRERV